jgi:glucosyl-3-phosphoglycerate phosphatase
MLTKNHQSRRCTAALVCFTGLVVNNAAENGFKPHEMGCGIAVRPSVLAIRHGLTQWNADQRWQGWADIALSSVGERQAELGAMTLGGLLSEDGRAVRIVASDLVRARRTAEFFATGLGIEHAAIDIRCGLRERNVGQWSGRTTREIEQRWPGMLEAWRNGSITELPEGESEHGFRERIAEVLAEVVHDSAARGDIVVLVSHGGVIGTFDRMLGLERIHVGNVSGRWFGLAAPTLATPSVVELPNASLADEGAAPLRSQPALAAVQGFGAVDLLSDDLLARFGKSSNGGERIERTVGNAL